MAHLRNLLLALAATALTLLVLEGAARLALAWSASRAVVGTDFSEYSEYDPQLGWRKRPGARLRFQRAEYAVDMVINSRGLRDPERGYEAAAGTHRLLALGDSFLEGYTVELEDSATQVLERSLGAGGCAVDVINGGTTGYSTDQSYLFFGSEGLRYSPEVVLLFFYYNDVLYNDLQFYTGGVRKPVFVLREGELQLYKQTVPRPGPTPAPLAGEAGEPPPEQGPRSVLLEWVKERLWFGAPRLYNELGRLGLWEPNRPIGARLELRVYQRRRIPEIEGAWEKTGLVLEALARDVAAAGARLLLVYVPNRMEVNERAWQLSQARYGMDEATWDRGLVLERLRVIAAAAELPILDLTPALREADRGLLGGPYYVQDGHWNPTGHRVAAEAVRDYLRDAGWLSFCSEPGS
jgi:lysophospholipase L1-like esterase